MIGRTQFAPRCVARVSHEGIAIAGSPTAARYLEIDATLVFADISGFTALSERLAKQGRIGAELINQLLSISFTGMLDVAIGLGGDLISFGGDSLCLMFDGSEHTQRAVAAAHGLRAALRRSAPLRAPIDKGTLRISTGVHSGPVVLALVGDRTPMLVTLGPTLTRTLALEKDAEGGEVFLSNDVRDHLNEAKVKWAALEQRTEEICVLSSLRQRSMNWMTPDQRVDTVGFETLGIDTAIRTDLLEGRTGLEHHPATIAFIHYEQVDEVMATKGVAQAVRVVHDLMCAIQQAASVENLSIIATDVDADGGKVVLAAGIPRSTGLEHDRMLAAVRQILDANTSLPIRVGVHAGTVFAGPVGSPTRASYTTLGDVVNTAARIMTKAGIGEALVSPIVLQGARTQWGAEEVAPFAAKGKSAYVRASTLGVAKATVAKPSGPTRLPFRGRVGELGQIEKAITAFRSGTSALVELVGDGGLGKSRLIEETLWNLGDLRVIHINGSPFARTQGYFALQTELRIAVGLPEEGDITKQLRALIKMHLPEDEPLLPLIGAAFGTAFAETKESKGVAEQFRSRRTNQLVSALLDSVVGQTGVVLVVDDSYWLDEATCSLINALIDDPDRKWFYLVARRPEPSYLDLSARSGLIRVELEQLDDESAFALAEAFAINHPLSDEVLRAAVSRCSGNPLLLELVLEALRSGASINDLPEEAERLVAARFDALSSDERDLLRAASVLGMDVSLPLLCCLTDATESEVTERIEGVLEYLVPESVGAYRFRHALVRETAYEGLSFASRRQLHADVVEAIENGVAHVGETISLLAVHAVAASLHDRIWKYASEASEIAHQRGLLAQAAEFARSAVISARMIEGVTRKDLGGILERLGDVEQLSGKTVQAQKAFDEAAKFADSNELLCRLMWKRAESLFTTQKYGASSRALDRVLQLITDDRSHATSALRADVLITKASIRYRRGQNAAAVRLLNEAWAAAERADDDTRRARINFIHGTVETELGSRHAEFYMNEAVRLLRPTNRRVELSKALGNLGYWEHYNGRWERAIQFYEDSARVADAAGDVLTAATARNNKAEVLSDRGLLDEAERLFVAAQRVFTMAGFAVGSALIKSNLGRVASRRGEFENARTQLTDAATQFSQIGVVAYAHEANARLAECWLFAGEALKAIELANQTLKLLGEGQNPVLEALLLRVVGQSQLRIGSPETKTTLNQALTIAEAFRSRFDQLLVLESLLNLPDLSAIERSEYVNTAVSLRSSLGIAERNAVSPMRQTASPNSVIINLSDSPPSEILLAK
jgi:class 3 adenylate cyclase/tetratricopeptide (TPR) repeat protein